MKPNERYRIDEVIPVMNRRNFIGCSGAATLGAVLPPVHAQESTIRRRNIPGTDEMLPVIGLGNSVVFQEGNVERSRQLIDILLEFGGSYVDISAASRDVVGGIAARRGISDDLFLGTYIQEQDDTADRRDAERQRTIQDKPALDLVLTRLVDDYIARADSFNRLKDEGLARYVGVARHQQQYHARMIRLIEQGAVRLDGVVARDPVQSVQRPAAPLLIQVGKKRFAKLLPPA